MPKKISLILQSGKQPQATVTGAKRISLSPTGETPPTIQTGGQGGAKRLIPQTGARLGTRQLRPETGANLRTNTTRANLKHSRQSRPIGDNRQNLPNRRTSQNYQASCLNVISVKELETQNQLILTPVILAVPLKRL